MAEGLAKKHFGTRLFIDSAGVREGQADGFMIAVMEEIGVDLQNHHPKLIEDLEDSSFDLIVALSPEAQHHALELTRTMACDVEFWNTFDPSMVEGSRESRLAAYRQVRDQLDLRIQKRFLIS